MPRIIPLTAEILKSRLNNLAEESERGEGWNTHIWTLKVKELFVKLAEDVGLKVAVTHSGITVLPEVAWVKSEVQASE